MPNGKLDVLLSGRFVGTVDSPESGHPVLLYDPAHVAEPLVTPLSSRLPSQQAPIPEHGCSTGLRDSCLTIPGF